MAPTVKEPTAPARKGTGIDEDYLAWIEEQVALLRARRFDLIDHENIAEELSDMGKSELHRLRSALRVLLMHMLKWDQQPERRGRSWSGTIREQRRRIERLLEESPSLRSRVSRAVNDSYTDALGWAAIETDLAENDFPAQCPYAWDDIMTRPFEADDEIRRP
jgi:hypothetical protein